MLLALLAVLVFGLLEMLQPLDKAQWAQVGLWLALGLVAHAGEFEINRPANTKIYLSAGFAIGSIALAVLPPAGAMVAISLGSLTWNQITRSARPLPTVAFNRAALALCAAAGSVTFENVHAMLPSWEILRLVGGSLFASIVYGGLSLGFAGAIVSIRAGHSWRRPWQWPLGGSWGVYLNYLALGLIGDLILTMDRTAGAVGLTLALIPMVITYFSLRQSADMRRLYDAIVSTLVDSLDLRDRDTGGHTRRVAALAVRLGRRLGMQGRALEDLHTAALLHDLGKIGVADSILHKPATLTDEERRQMQRHPELGANLLRMHGLLDGAIVLIRHHQEYFDGAGYPDGLRGEQIPLGSRIIAVADAFMAMVDGRPYQQSRGPYEAYAELQRCAGAQFDPRVVAALHAIDWETVFKETPLALEPKRV